MKISDEQKAYRKWFREEIEKLIEYSKLPSEDERHCSKQTIEEILNDTPEYNMSNRIKTTMKKKLYENSL